MKKFLLVVMLLVFAFSFAMAQTDAGLRGGVRYGVTGRMFTENNAIEALITMRGSGIILTGMYQWHKPLEIGEVEGLTWYFGGGVHVGYWRLGSSQWYPGTATWGTDLALGLDVIAGVEYDLEPLINFPITVSLDYKPGFDLFGRWAGTFADAAFSIRYAF